MAPVDHALAEHCLEQMGQRGLVLADIAAERQRQVEVEGWTPAHDDAHDGGTLAVAAGCYALYTDAYPNEGQPPPQWPWEASWWKPKHYRLDLVRAAALLLAEVERFDRLTRRLPPT